MLVSKKPISTAIPAKSLEEILTYENRDIYVIEDQFQRPFVWDSKNITEWIDSLFSMINDNLTKRQKSPYNYRYLDTGSLDYSEVEDINKKFVPPIDGVEYKSVIDGSQRLRLSMATLMALLTFKSNHDGEEYVDLSCIKSTDDKIKLMIIGKDDFIDCYDYVRTTPIKVISKECFKHDRLNAIKKEFNKENVEHSFKNLFAYVLYLIDEKLDDCNKYDFINQYIEIFLKNTFFHEENLDRNYKFQRFLDRNNKGTPMSENDLYPKYIINIFDGEDKQRIYDAFTEFNNLKNETNNFYIQSKKKDISLYVMEEVLKIKLVELGYDAACNYNYSLRDPNYGVEACRHNGYYFTTAEQAIEYFNTCKELCLWLINSSITKQDNFVDNNFFFRSFKEKNCIWWHFIKPCFYLDKYINDVEKRRITKDLMFRGIYIFESVIRQILHITNSAQAINTLEKITVLIINSNNKDFYEYRQELINIIKDLQTSRVHVDAWQNVVEKLKTINYNVETEKPLIKRIFLSLEYDLVQKFGFNIDGLFVLNDSVNNCKRIKYDLDHIKPKSKIVDCEEYELCVNSIGNLVPLESNLNQSKGNNDDTNFDKYRESQFNITRLLSEDYIGTMDSNLRNDVEKYPFLTRYSREKLCDLSVDDIVSRRNELINFIIAFVRKDLYN